MKELTLSFNYYNDKLHREYFLKYNNYSLLNKYNLLYKIDSVSLRVDYFRDLVSLLKRPTRSSSISDDIFIKHIEYFEISGNNIFVHMRKPTRFLPVNNIFNSRTIPTPVLFDTYLAKPSFKFHTNYYKNFFLDRINDDKLSYFYNTYILKSKKYFVSNNSFLIKDRYHKSLCVFENLFFREINLKEPLNIFEHIFLLKEFFLDVYNFFGINKFSVTDYYYNYSLNKNDSKILSIYYQNINLKYSNIILNLYDSNNFILQNKKYIDIFKNIFLKNNLIYHVNIFENDFAYKDNILFSIYGCVQSKKYTQNYINYHENVYAFPVYSKFLEIFNIDFFKKTNDALKKYYNYYFAEKNNSNNTNIYNNIVSFRSLYKAFNYNINLEYFYKKYSNFYLYNEYSVNKNINNKLYYCETNTYFTKKYKFIKYKFYSSNNNIDFYSKYKKFLYLNEKYDFTNKNKKELNIYDYYKNHIYINKIKYNLYLNNNNFFINKSNHNLYRINTIINYYKTSKSLNESFYNNSFKFLYKSYFNLYDYYTYLFTNKTFKKTYYDSLNVFTFKIYKNIFEEYNNIFIYKEYKNSDIYNYYIPDITKQLIFTFLFTNNQYVIYTINKINKPSFTYEFINEIHKKYKDNRYFDTLTNFVNKKSFPSFFEKQDLLCDKLCKSQEYLDLMNTWMIKSKISIWFINNDSFISKNNKNIFTQKYIDIFKINKPFSIDHFCYDIYKRYKNTSIYSSIKLHNTKRDIFVNNNIFIDNKNKNFFILKNEFITNIKYSFLHQDIYTSKSILNLLCNKENIFTDTYKHSDKNVINEFLSIEKHIDIYQIENILRYNYNFKFYDQYTLDRTILLNKFPCFDEIYKTWKEMDYLIESESDFAWVYEEEEGFNDPFKIDELLLPENDTKYENFEDIIFNRKTLKPRNPVKIIDDYTFIAKYPNQYPIKNDEGENAYKDIALDYLEVRTSIMRQVFIGYYKVWQDHIFEFSRMTINQSANKILDYLYVWILMYFSEEDIPEALRVFKQIRWYLERSIIECSEYYITYEPSDLKSGSMNTTKIPIPSDLDDNPANDTMFVDTDLHVIRNNPNKLRQEAHITFYIDNKRDTTISFSLNTFDPVYVMLNDEIIDNITVPTQDKMVYNIPYTGDVNNFRIGKLGIDNNDNYFYIGNIIIAGMGNDGNLNIEFNPKIQGNKVLNHVSRKVIEYMNLYNDNETLMKNLVKGNVHFSELYEKLLEYWENHWERKDKGKRWTIKRA